MWLLALALSSTSSSTRDLLALVSASVTAASFKLVLVATCLPCFGLPCNGAFAWQLWQLPATRVMWWADLDKSVVEFDFHVGQVTSGKSDHRCNE